VVANLQAVVYLQILCASDFWAHFNIVLLTYLLASTAIKLSSGFWASFAKEQKSFVLIRSFEVFTAYIMLLIAVS